MSKHEELINETWAHLPAGDMTSLSDKQMLKLVNAYEDLLESFELACNSDNAHREAYEAMVAERDQWKRHFEARSTWVPDKDLLMEDLKEVSDENEKFKAEAWVIPGLKNEVTYLAKQNAELVEALRVALAFCSLEATWRPILEQALAKHGGGK